jgi:hypothetical protein
MSLKSLTNEDLLGLRTTARRSLFAVAAAFDRTKATACRIDIDAAMEQFYPLDVEARARGIV